MNMNNLDKQYTDLLQDILNNGVEKKDRTGTGTISVFGRQIRHKMSEGFPLLTTKKMYMKGIITELIWFLQGDTNIKFLVDNDCHIWDGDAYKAFEKWKQETTAKIRRENPTIDFQPLEYESREEFINKIKTDDEFAEKWGDLGPIYGKQWRNWNTLKGMEVHGGDGIPYVVGWELKKGENGPTYNNIVVDQIAILINDLKTNPDSRRLMVSAWNVGEIDQMVLPPCHYGFQVYTRELSLDERRILWNKKVEPSENACEYLDGLSLADTHDIFNQDNIQSRAISLMWNQRSVDTFLGLPFNIASYGLLLEIIAKEVNMVPDELIGNLGDVHLYSNHIEQAREQIGRELEIEERWELYHKLDMEPVSPQTGCDDKELHRICNDCLIPKRTREPFPLPTLNINTEFWQTLSGECGVGPLNTGLRGLEINDFTLENYVSHPVIKAPLSN
jgi:thymidylate synthase